MKIKKKKDYNFFFFMKFIRYKCEFVGKMNEIHILINEKSNREIPRFFKISRPKIEPGVREWNPNDYPGFIRYVAFSVFFNIFFVPFLRRWFFSTIVYHAMHCCRYSDFKKKSLVDQPFDWIVNFFHVKLSLLFAGEHNWMSSMSLKK